MHCHSFRVLVFHATPSGNVLFITREIESVKKDYPDNFRKDRRAAKKFSTDGKPIGKGANSLVSWHRFLCREPKQAARRKSND
jgi:hypothetical protein